MATRKRPVTAQQDLAEARRRAKTARTPLAKAVTKQVVEATERTYSGQAAREIAAQTRPSERTAAVGTTAKRDAAARKAVPRKK